jgi:amino acid transporter
MIASMHAGALAPLVLLCVGMVLLLFRSVYHEAVSALPVNGGCYNVLLNSTWKPLAGVAGVATFLSYIATADISAKVGVEYLFRILPSSLEHALQIPMLGLDPHVVPVFLGTVVVLGGFALLVATGVKDSAFVAKLIWGFNVLTIIAFVITGLVFALTGTSHWTENWAYTQRMLYETAGKELFRVDADTAIFAKGGLMAALFFAFSASLLGVSGFESSANFVEEQKKGVFPKTLRNMQWAVTIANPLVALVCLIVLPIEKMVAGKDFMLSDVAYGMGGNPLRYMVCLDAFLVLCGAVLTSYVGVSGLLSRMSEDGCVPHFLSKKNAKGAFPLILLSFFALCVSILVITRCDLLPIAGVYTIAFLAVMSLFAVGNLLLKVRRPKLKREVRAKVPVVVLAFLATSIGLVGNILIDPRNPRFFAMYFVPFTLVVLGTIYRDLLLRAIAAATRGLPPVSRWLEKHFSGAIEGRFVCFIRTSERLGAMLEYIRKNEPGARECVLVICEHPVEQHKTDNAITTIQNVGLYPDLEIRTMMTDEPFSPATVFDVAKKNGIPLSRVFIGSIEPKHQWDYPEFGGVRVVHE